MLVLVTLVKKLQTKNLTYCHALDFYKYIQVKV